MKITPMTDKRILQRELHLRGRVILPEIQKLSEELPDLSGRVSKEPLDTDKLKERLLAEAAVRGERIRRSLADATKQAAYRTEQSDLEG